MLKGNRILRSRRGVTMIELMVAMVAGVILLWGLSTLLVLLWTGMGESRDFAEAVNRVELIRQLSFDARTGQRILSPTTDGAAGNYTSGGVEGDRIQFESLHFDPGTDTTSVWTITWESQRPAGSPVGTPYSVIRWLNKNDGGGTNWTFNQNQITSFEVVRNTGSSFSVAIETTEAQETMQIQLAPTLRNVVD